VDTLSDRLGGGLVISAALLTSVTHLACVHKHPGNEVLDSSEIGNQQGYELSSRRQSSISEPVHPILLQLPDELLGCILTGLPEKKPKLSESLRSRRMGSLRA
jgi:hypothetical protein